MTGLPDERIHPIYHPPREQVERLAGAAGNEVGASPQPVIGTTLLLGNRLCDFLL